MTPANADAGVSLCHPNWLAICADIGRIMFEGCTRYQRAIDSVIAHQLGNDERSRASLKLLGVENSNSLRAICERYDIELPK